MDQENCAFVTLATNDNYTRGALVLAHSLKLVRTKYKLVVLVTPGISEPFRNKLHKYFDLVEDVNVLDSKDDISLSLIQRPELGITFTKLHCWKLTQFTKCVFLDADTLVVKNCDELFEREELSAVPDIGWPDCFNSGVFVFKPSKDTFKGLMEMAAKDGSFDGGDQGLLNSYFNDWSTKDISRHLSFIYNMNTNATYTYLPAYKQFGKNVKIVHFLGNKKPWMYSYNKQSKTVETSDCDHAYEHLKLWWDIYIQHVEPDEHLESMITKSVSDLALSSPAREASTSSPVYERRASDAATRLYAWEHGQIDYMGRDSFENIRKKLDETINGSDKK
ncbi:LOW QUALITY PROTEIN: glycogenin-1-like [Uloborus diversus]|uniref:LOW QUALITY PROTEIN: glycogenin-1-like n=1 Tax=Uloborus diversus TaxID=327109 RepID=UPI00240997D2|nr:LOW QUALITY PROTEIN: glycogenin-1-like [Uloborus diversus]